MKLVGDLATSLQCKVGIAMYIRAKGGECFVQRKAKSGDGDVFVVVHFANQLSQVEKWLFIRVS